MTYTVKGLAKLSGVSVRTLHHYDEIGLLKPAYYGVNGYRHYEEEQLLLLQQILFFRELGFKLNKIHKIVTSSGFSQVAALRAHRQVLEKDVERIRELIGTIDKTIEHLIGEQKMAHSEMYEGFNPEKQAEYEKYLVERYGEVAERHIAESKENVKGWKKEDHQRAKDEADAINKKLAETLKSGLKPDDPAVQVLIREHYGWINQFYKPSKTTYIELGQLYSENAEFHAYFQAIQEGLAPFIAEGMRIFAENEL